MTEEGNSEKNETKKETGFSRLMYALIIITVAIMGFNQYQIMQISSGGSFTGAVTRGSISTSGIDISNVDISEIKSTKHAIAAVFPLDGMATTQDAIDIMIPVGTPDYAGNTGISYDDPVASLDLLKNIYYNMKDDLKQNDPEIWQRYLNLALQPVGISCEFCCGVGPIGIRSNGDLSCGCAHNPAVQGLTMFLMKYTDYSDAEILREVMIWKTIFFPRNMISNALEVSGMDESELAQLPGMIGGC